MRYKRRTPAVREVQSQMKLMDEREAFDTMFGEQDSSREASSVVPEDKVEIFARKLQEWREDGRDADDKRRQKEASLLQAAKLGDVQVGRKLLADGVNPNARGSNGYTALHMASFYGHLPVVKLLVRHGADVDCITKDHLPEGGKAREVQGSTPLHLAATTGQDRIVQFMVDKKANVKIKDKAEEDFGRTALEMAHDAAIDGLPGCREGAKKCVEILEAVDKRQASIQRLQTQIFIASRLRSKFSHKDPNEAFKTYW